MDNKLAIDQICELLNCQPGEAAERVRGLVEGFPGYEPPSDTRMVITQVSGIVGPIFNFWATNYWYEYDTRVVRWWELPT